VDAGYKRGTVAVKLASVQPLCEAIRWRGLRDDNPAAGVKAPRDRTSREEKAKFLPLDGLKRLLDAPKGDGLQARRGRAILALMGVHGLRVAEVAGPLGLASVTTTQVYAQVVDPMTENPARYLEAVMGA
jgi:site-specific recombinase XerC